MRLFIRLSIGFLLAAVILIAFIFLLGPQTHRDTLSDAPVPGNTDQETRSGSTIPLEQQQNQPQREDQRNGQSGR